MYNNSLFMEDFAAAEIEGPTRTPGSSFVL